MLVCAYHKSVVETGVVDRVLDFLHLDIVNLDLNNLFDYFLDIHSFQVFSEVLGLNLGY